MDGTGPNVCLEVSLSDCTARCPFSLQKAYILLVYVC